METTTRASSQTPNTSAKSDKLSSPSYSLDFPKNVTLGELIFDKRNLVVVDKNMKLEDAARLLEQHNFLCAPVFDPEMKYFVGMIDVYDIAQWVALGYSLEKAYKDKDFEKLGFKQATVMDLVNQSERARNLFIFESTQSLESAMRILSFRDHRVLVCNSKDSQHVTLAKSNPEGGKNPIICEEVALAKSYRLLTQSDVIQYIGQHKDQLSPSLQEVLGKSLLDLGLVLPISSSARTVPIVKILEDQPAIDAFAKMFDEGVTALAVVDNKGRLKDNISASDLRGLTQDKLKYLGLSIGEFLKAMRSTHRPKRLVTAKPTDTLASVIDKILSSRVHRVWIVDDESKPIEVDTLTDIISVLLGMYSTKVVA